MARGTGFILVAILAAFALGGGLSFYQVPAFRLVVDFIRGRQNIPPGFVGMANFGHWRLICAPGPAPQEGLVTAGLPDAKAADASARPALNSCRVNQEMPAPEGAGDASGQNPARVIVAANFSLVGPSRAPAMMLRLPATAAAGDIVSLGLDDNYTVKTTVRDCAGNECLAAGALSQSDWSRLAATKALAITFPAAGRQLVLLSLPVDGLDAAMAAMGRAQVSRLP